MRHGLVILTVLGSLLIGNDDGFLLSTASAQPKKNAVVELLEDDGEVLIKQFTNPGGEGGVASVEKDIIYSGKSGIKIIPLQRYHPSLAGWAYRIVANPKPGEYRYLRLAWKGSGCSGIMVQFAHANMWELRYTAGINQYGWATKFVSDKAPTDWTVVTCDMYKDFGERTITGMALTVFGGQAGYFDHIYLGRTIEDLDRIDATGLSKGKPVELTNAEMNLHWKELGGTDAPKAYLAFWSLVAASKRAVPFLEKQLLASKGKVDAKQLQKWIDELDHAKFSVREHASRNLSHHLEEAAPLLENQLKQPPSLEVQLRIEKLLAMRKGPNPEHVRIDKAVQALEFMATPQASKALAALAKEEKGTRVGIAASAALQRLEASGQK